MSIAVLDKAFTVLDVMARAGWLMTLAARTEEGPRPKPMLHRMLRNLRDRGHVTQNDRGAYTITQRLASIRVHSRDQQSEGKGAAAHAAPSPRLRRSGQIEWQVGIVNF